MPKVQPFTNVDLQVLLNKAEDMSADLAAAMSRLERSVFRTDDDPLIKPAAASRQFLSLARTAMEAAFLLSHQPAMAELQDQTEKELRARNAIPGRER